MGIRKLNFLERISQTEIHIIFLYQTRHNDSLFVLQCITHLRSNIHCLMEIVSFDEVHIMRFTFVKVTSK